MKGQFEAKRILIDWHKMAQIIFYITVNIMFAAFLTRLIVFFNILTVEVFSLNILSASPSVQIYAIYSMYCVCGCLCACSCGVISYVSLLFSYFDHFNLCRAASFGAGFEVSRSQQSMCILS